MKLQHFSVSMVERAIIQWLGIALSTLSISITIALLLIIGIRYSPMVRGINPPSSTVITAVPQQLRLSEYAVIQDLHSKKTQQRRLIEGVSVHPFDPLSGLDAQ